VEVISQPICFSMNAGSRLRSKPGRHRLAPLPLVPTARLLQPARLIVVESTCTKADIIAPDIMQPIDMLWLDWIVAGAKTSAHG